MKLLLKECQQIMGMVQKLENYATEEAEKRAKDKKEEIKVNPHLFYATGQVSKMIGNKIFSEEVGYRPVFQKFLQFQEKQQELRKKHTKEIKAKGKKTKIEFDKKAYDVEYKKLKKEHKSDLDNYMEFQKKEIEFNGSLYKISVKHLPELVPITLIDDLNYYELLQE
jgi:hypothetical protein